MRSLLALAFLSCGEAVPAANAELIVADSASAVSSQNVLTLYAIPAPHSLLNPRGMNWDSPGALVRGTLVNEAGSYLGLHRAIGHVGVRLQCGDAHFLGGMTNIDNADFGRLVLDDQIGLGMLFDNVPGEIESEDVLQATIDDRQGGRIAVIAFLLRTDVCHALLAYKDEYARRNIQKNYGLYARPLYQEGAGCSAFALSFLELANLIEPRFIDGWSFSVRVPLWNRAGQPLIGGSMHPENRIPLSRLVAITRPWAQPNEDGIELFGWDPTLMYEWIRAQSEDKIITLDRRNVEPMPMLMDGTFFY